MTPIGSMTIPGRTASQNDMKRLGKWGEIRAKKKLREDAHVLALIDFPPELRFSRGKSFPVFRKRKLVITCYRAHLLDSVAESLAGGALKHIVDGLKIGTVKTPGAGVIVDDNEKWCERDYRQVKDADERLVIEVFE